MHSQKPTFPQPAKEPKQGFKRLYNSVGLAGLQEAKLVCRQGLPCIAVTEESTDKAQLLQSLVTTGTLWPFQALLPGPPTSLG